MKHFFLLVATATLIVFSSFKISGIDEVLNAVKTGNAAQVAKFFDNTIEISMPDKSNNFSKSQGEIVLKDFFNNNPVKGFDVIHKGQNAGSQYCIGTLITTNGSFRTTIYMKEKENVQVLQELRFESK